MKAQQTTAARDAIAALRGIIFETVIGEAGSGDPAADYGTLIEHFDARPGKGIAPMDLLRGLARMEGITISNGGIRK